MVCQLTRFVVLELICRPGAAVVSRHTAHLVFEVVSVERGRARARSRVGLCCQRAVGIVGVVIRVQRTAQRRDFFAQQLIVVVVVGADGLRLRAHVACPFVTIPCRVILICVGVSAACRRNTDFIRQADSRPRLGCFGWRVGAKPVVFSNLDRFAKIPSETNRKKHLNRKHHKPILQLHIKLHDV